MRCSWTASFSSVVEEEAAALEDAPPAAGAPEGGRAASNSARSARTSSVNARFSRSSRSSLAPILARSGDVCAASSTGHASSQILLNLLGLAIENLLQFPPHRGG